MISCLLQLDGERIEGHMLRKRNTMEEQVEIQKEDLNRTLYMLAF